MRTTIMLGLTAALLSGNQLEAQDSSLTLQPGEVIRVSGPKKFRFTGEFMGRDSASLVIRASDGQTRKVPRAWITKVEIRTRHKSGAGAGALVGASAGAALGLVAVGSVDSDPYWGTDCCSAGDYASGGLLFGAAGAGLGAIIGAMTHKDTWVRIPAEQWQATPESGIESQNGPVSTRKKSEPRLSQGPP